MNLEKMQENAKRLGVSTEVYLHLRRSNRKFRYFVHDLKRETIIVEGEKVIFIPSREDSLDRLKEDEGVEFAVEQRSVEDLAMDVLLLEQLHRALVELTAEERCLIEEVFFSKNGEGKTEREAAESLGLPQKTLNERKNRALTKLRKILENGK